MKDHPIVVLFGLSILVTRDIDEDVRERVRALANTEAFQPCCAPKSELKMKKGAS
jgi:hypothetical protein